MTGLEFTPKNSVPRQCDNDVIAMRFTSDITDLVKGIPMKLLSTGKVAYVAAATDFSIGVSNNNNKIYKPGDEVIVVTHFLAEVFAQANTAVVTGELLSCVGFDATTRRGDYDNAGALVTAVCLAGGVDNAEIRIGILRCPIPRPI